MIPKMRVLHWRPLRKNSLCGFARIEFASGLIVSDITILSGTNGFWASPPSRPMIGRDNTVLTDGNGKIRYVPVIEFRDRETRDKWSAGVIEALRTAYPEALHQ